MKITQAQQWRRERGSALLLTLLLTVLGAILCGLCVDTVSLLWVRSHAQTAANLAAQSVVLELSRNPGATPAYLEQTARATAAWNGIRHGAEGAQVHLEKKETGTHLLVRRDAGVYFLRMFRPEPIPVYARAEVRAAMPTREGL